MTCGIASDRSLAVQLARERVPLGRCLGAQPARMEAAVVVEEVAPLLRGVEVVRAPQYLANLSFRMPDALVIQRKGD